MKPLRLSSGDLLADRRADYAEMLMQEGDASAAAELLVSALELAPHWAAGWFRAGEMHAAAGQTSAAIEAWRMAARLDPADRMGAVLKLELAGVARAESGAPSAFVETLFDQYAATFDGALVDALDYRAPALIARALATHREHFGHAVDLGCGTGLMGEQLRPVVETMEGYDISAEMLKRAEGKQIYDRLEKVDLHTLSLAEGSADLVTAADVFMYLGRLDAVVGTVAAALRRGGLFAFSVERHDGPEDVVLRDSRRYAHSEGYVRRELGKAGLEIASLTQAVVRQDRDKPITGLIAVACRK